MSKMLSITKIEEFCNLIFLPNDNFDFDTFKLYIDDIISNGIEITGSKHEIRSIVRSKVLTYIHDCTLNQLPFFAFASDSSYNILRMKFEEYYRARYREIHKTDSKFPAPFEYAFDFIQETIDSHTLFEEFSIQMTSNAVEYAKKEALEASESAMLSAKVSAKIAKNAANQAASKAVEVAIEQVVKDKKMEGYAEKIIDKQINRVTKNISETSVTILGIFAGIVLTVVAGLFYSSSVINNINSASFYKLMAVSALVGFVCINLMAIMFYYVERIKSKGESKMARFSWVILSVNLVLIIAMVWFGVLQSHTSNNVVDSHLEKAVVDVNITTLNDENHPDASGANNSIEENTAPNKSTLNPEENTSKDKV